MAKMQLLLKAAVNAAVVYGAQLRGQPHELSTISINRAEVSAATHAKFMKAVQPAVSLLLGDDAHGDAHGSIGNSIKNGAAALDIDSAIAAVKPPADIVNMLLNARKHKHGDKQEPDLDPEAVAKAVTKLNDMVESAQVRLDAKTIECKEFKEQNRDTAAQVTTDLNRMGGTIANLKRAELGINAEIADATADTETVKEEQAKQKTAYETQKSADDAQMRINQADLQVTSFMLELSRCKDAAMLQVVETQTGASTEVEVCNGTNVTFKDPRFQSAKQQLTARTQQLLDFALSHSHSEDSALRMASLAFGDGLEDLEDGTDDEKAPAEKAVRASLAMVQQFPEGLREEPTIAPATEPMDAGKQGNRCAGTKPNCAVLHDTFSALWGEIKDLVEELQGKLDADAAAWKELNDGFNTQIASLTTHKGELGSSLAETISSNIAETDMQGKKDAELKELDDTFEKTWGECEQITSEILFTEICGVITVRNEVVQAGYDIPKDEVVDCSFTDWTAHECTVPCDDNLVGGTQLLTREVITPKTANGHQCPVMNMTKKCNAIPCPVDCKLSEWEDYSKCTKECGGGVQSHTRQLDVKPKNGGESCDVLQESQLCHTFSCDRNCALSEWTPFSPCTQACDSGYQIHSKSVTIPTRGEGTCPAERDAERFERQECNTQKCIGDEECIASLDVVLALDGSGSLTEAGFDVIKEFAVKVVEKFRAEAYSKEAVQVAIVQFGNGKLEDDSSGLGGVGTVSDAILGQGLSGDMEATKETIKGLTWQRGFTNMAQGIAKAGTLLKTSMRVTASGVAIVITDGRPSFKLSTGAAVKKLREASTLMIVQVKEFPKEENIALMKEYVSEPAEVNYLHIDGKKKLKAAYDTYATELLVRSCPRAVSVSQETAKHKEQGFKIIREAMYCDDVPALTVKAETPQLCHAGAQNIEGWTSFSWSTNGDCRVFERDCQSDYIDNFDYNVYSALD